MRILITAGGTEEPLDGVRRLANTSTGATGLELARVFHARGAEVFLLHAERVAAGGLPVRAEPFLTFSDLEAGLQRLLGEHRFDTVIHLAAVSDYHLASLEVDGQAVETGGRGKIGSGHDLVLRLRPNPKLIDNLRQWSCNPGVKVVGFKLTDTPETATREESVRALLDRGVTDLVVHNDAGEIRNGRHPATVFNRSGVLAKTNDKTELAQALFGLLSQGEIS